MAASVIEREQRPTVGLVAVTLPLTGPQLRQVWIDEDTLLIGFNPAVLNEFLVSLWLDEEFPAGYELTVGVPA
jgi:hypothetical protein